MEKISKNEFSLKQMELKLLPLTKKKDRGKSLNHNEKKFWSKVCIKCGFSKKIIPTSRTMFIAITEKKNYIFKLKKEYYTLRFLKKFFKLERKIYNYAKLINFNKSKFSNLMLNLNNQGLKSIMYKICDKGVKLKTIGLKSVHLNSDVFSLAVALKLRDRKNKAAIILKDAILKMVKIPSLHTLITNDDSIENLKKNKLLYIIQQQVVSGVRFEASGRLTRRLTAQRSIFKYRYLGSLKNIRSSFNMKPSTILRGHVKSNSQYTI